MKPDKLSKTLAEFDAGKLKRKTIRRPRKPKGLAPVTLDIHDVITVRWLIDHLAWLPNDKRDALARLRKAVGP